MTMKDDDIIGKDGVSLMKLIRRAGIEELCTMRRQLRLRDVPCLRHMA
jgi:hypothetical protein